MEELPERIKTIKIDVRTWDSLKSMKKENETFNDVIRDLIMERTKSIGNENIKAIKYGRKTSFFTEYYQCKKIGYKEIGYEFEYNDVKGSKNDFTLDLKLKKVFFGKRSLNPSEFFGVDNAHKHYSEHFIIVYAKALALALEKEFNATFRILDDELYINIALWRKFYYDYRLSEESFKDDIEEPLRLSEEDKPTKEWIEKIKESIFGNI